MIKKIKNYEERLIKKIKNYEVFLNKIISFYDNCLLKIIDFLKSASYKLLDLISKFGKFMRYSTYPLHWIWIKIHLAMFNQEDKLEDLPIFKLGAHYIYGLPKCGKSTIIYQAMMEYAFHTGKNSYTTANMEIPRKNIYGEEVQVAWYKRIRSEQKVDGIASLKAQIERDKQATIAYFA